jgi:hypothetical protein
VPTGSGCLAAAGRCGRPAGPKQTPGIEKDCGMAAHGEVEYAVADGNDYPAHEQTYLSFLSLVKWVMGIVILIVVGMAYFLV